MIIEVKNEDTYVPKYGGNRDLPEEEQMKVHHRYLVPGERKKYLYTQPIRLDMATGEVDGKVEYIQDERGIAEAVITKIENLSVRSGGKDKKITTGSQLYTTSGVPQALVTEIESYLLTASPEVDADFLSKPSPST